MSDKFTEVTTPSGGIGEWGHVPYAEAVERLRVHFERQRRQAESALAELDSGQVRVFHQYGPYAGRNRREVKP